MTRIVHPDLLSDIAAYCARESMTRSAFGLAAVRDPRLVFDIEEGRELRSRTVERVRHFINTGEPVADGEAAA